MGYGEEGRTENGEEGGRIKGDAKDFLKNM